MSAIVIHNVRDRRNGCIGSWLAKPLVYDELGPEHVGMTVIYQPGAGDPEAGTLTSWKNGIVFARYSTGDTAAGAHPSQLMLGIATPKPQEATHG